MTSPKASPNAVLRCALSLQADGLLHLFVMLEYEQAVDRILAQMPSPQMELVPLAEACGRVLLQSIVSPIDLPCFDNSAMDGYAVRAADIVAAKPDRPVRLRLAGRIAAGEMFAGEISAGQCVRLFTGSPLPNGADAVVMQEDSRTNPADPNEVLILESARPWENVRLRGEDIQCNKPVAHAGEILTPGRIALLGAAGVAQVPASRQPTVGLLATGSELKDPGEPLGPGQIYESNRLALASLAQRAGGRPRVFPLVSDDLTRTRDLLADAFKVCDLVVSSGGVSVGELDFVKQAFEELGGQLGFWRVAIKPGRPFVFGRLASTPDSPGQDASPRARFLFGLPGNPVSAWVTFLLLVRPALLRWQGATELHLARHPGVLSEPLANPGPRRHFIRVKVDPEAKVSSAGLQASHALSSLAAANGLVDVPPATTLPADMTVQVMRVD